MFFGYPLSNRNIYKWAIFLLYHIITLLCCHINIWRRQELVSVSKIKVTFPFQLRTFLHQIMWTASNNSKLSYTSKQGPILIRVISLIRLYDGSYNHMFIFCSNSIIRFCPYEPIVSLIRRRKTCFNSSYHRILDTIVVSLTKSWGTHDFTYDLSWICFNSHRTSYIRSSDIRCSPF